jgi:hypothetical protein
MKSAVGRRCQRAYLEDGHSTQLVLTSKPIPDSQMVLSHVVFTTTTRQDLLPSLCLSNVVYRRFGVSGYTAVFRQLPAGYLLLRTLKCRRVSQTIGRWRLMYVRTVPSEAGVDGYYFDVKAPGKLSMYNRTLPLTAPLD